uniref:STI1/HOP DP domain-containing protein n=1 Tax=Octactis speculum TaxID=3111310 RepID=A0A7S2FPN2_9STRA
MGPLMEAAMKKQSVKQKPQQQQQQQQSSSSPRGHRPTKTKTAGSSSHEDVDQTQVDKVMQDEEMRALLMDPEMQQVMITCQQPGALQKYMVDPLWGPRIRKLAQSGLVQIQT